MIDIQQSEHWLSYRDSQNNIAHDYGEGFAEEALAILPDFISDTKALVKILRREGDD